MKEKYFIYNGKKYNSGTVIVIRWACNISKTIINTKAIFIEHDLENKQYVVEVNGKRCSYLEDHFYRVLCTVVDNNKVNAVNNIKQHTVGNELNIDGLLIAWAWYIFIMAIGIIFYGRIAIWILASVIFFNYRHKKLKEAGYK